MTKITPDIIKEIAKQHNVTFVNRSYDMASTGPISLLQLVSIVTKAININSPAEKKVIKFKIIRPDSYFYDEIFTGYQDGNAIVAGHWGMGGVTFALKDVEIID